MPPLNPFRARDENAERRDWMFQTRSHAWQQAGLARQLGQTAARRARLQLMLLVPALVGVIVLYQHRHRLLHSDLPIRVFTVIALVVGGWWLARDVGRAVGPLLFRRMDPATAGTMGFLVRLATIAVAIVFALDVAGLRPQTLAVGGAVTAVVFGLAAQQTLGNLIAGTVLLSARPFRVGDRVRLQGGSVGGNVEGVVASLGLLYTTLANGADSIMVPNNVVLSLAIVPLREPDAVDLRARLRAGIMPTDVQELLDRCVTVATRNEPHIVLEEIDGDEVVIRVEATPEKGADGPKLADEILAAMATFTRDTEAGAPEPRVGGS